MKGFSSILVRISLSPLILVVIGALSLLVFDRQSASSLDDVIVRHDEATRTKETIQKAIGDLAAAQQNASDHLTLSDSGVDKARLDKLRTAFAGRMKSVREALQTLGGTTGRADAEATLAALDTYQKAADQMGQMAEVDRLMGVGLLGATQDHFTEVMEALRVWRTHIDQAAADHIAAAKHDSESQRLVSWLVVLAVNLAALSLVLFSSRGITGPLRRLEARMVALTSGDLESAIADQQLNNEIGRMARTLEVFKTNAIERQRLEAHEKETKARGEARQGRIASLTREFDDAVSGLISAVQSTAGELHDASRSMSEIADKTERQSAAVSAATEDASNNVSTIAGASTQMSASIGEIAKQVHRAAEVTASAVAEAGNTNQRIGSLAAAASRIGEVVDLITDIASQTNLLALNATIEAARAGEAGKGFAVVASEVKHLANQTAKATEDIAAQISGIQEESRAAVAAIRNITTVVGDINDMSSAIAGAVEQQGAAIQEIVRNVELAATGTRAIAASIADVAAAAETTGSTAGTIESTAAALQRQNDALLAAGERFLGGGKTA
ncbi:MAG: HAMP domain-containing protein [Telmatospirillum sp.]|nr:HAMP domain-containing protein [Telmatospirillum sp.]